jgi:hypothetical protein
VQVLQNTSQLLALRSIERVEPNSPVCKELVKLLKTVADGYDSIQQALQLKNYVPLFGLLSSDTRKLLAVYLLETIIKKETPLDNPDHVRLFPVQRH